MTPLLLSILRIAVTLVAAYVLLVVLAAGCQRKLVYYPSKADTPRLRSEAERIGLVPWTDAEGERIGWTNEQSAAPPCPAVVVFHGNAGHALHRFHFVQALASNWEEEGLRVFVFEYPGYADRSGRPSERVIKKAAAQATEELLDRTSTDRLFVLGESLGSGVACHLAGKMPDQIAGVLLITPFTSLVDVAKRHYPYLPVAWLLRDRYKNVEPLENYAGPVAVILAERDAVVPPPIGHRLYESYDGPKRLWIQKGRGHNTLNYDPTLPWWTEVVDFLREPQ